ncbi:hypothetical protein BEWA_032060 [Theileria equi strain WA]|uniref:Uncharacterized protein n=1 Tax=Theileria equi strain WA TaxID=1537102 RepID=L0AYM9_THEEQ|nr:hypothetical protein BEWA_032060 [Theileria equi strain WA]AFZ80353.1 hypothetical protein BEWA_032060 [Theileria equi strain WA]|eukprot:XP_004830019.1 hypothetical protein BEWA_032060 [Theileria equi strain WA]
MTYLWKADDCTENGAFKHIWPLHYHLYKNDLLAASDELRRGADPLFEDDNGVSALQLAMKFLIKHLNKCLASAAPLGNSRLHAGNFQSTLNIHLGQNLGPDATPVLGGLSDYNAVGSGSLAESDDSYATLLDQTISFFDGSRDDEFILTTHARLLRRTKGLFSFIKLISENAKFNSAVHDSLCQSIAMLSYPSLYAAVMNVLVSKTRFEQGFSNVWESRKVYSLAMKCRINGIYLLKFITQISEIFQQLLALFHFDLYSGAFNERFSCRSGHVKRLTLDYMNTDAVELFAHLAFVTDLPLLFNAMVLQPKFSPGKHARFDWDSVLSNTLRNREKLGIYADPLLRKRLGDRVEREFEQRGQDPIFV